MGRITKFVLWALLSQLVIAGEPVGRQLPAIDSRLPAAERQQCERWLNELTLIEARKRLGAVKDWAQSPMKRRADEISRNYQRRCTARAPQDDPPTGSNTSML
jgi:hypothetical protein